MEPEITLSDAALAQEIGFEVTLLPGEVIFRLDRMRVGIDLIAAAIRRYRDSDDQRVVLIRQVAGA